MTQYYALRIQPFNDLLCPCGKIIVPLIRKDQNIHILRIALLRIQRETSEKQDISVSGMNMESYALAGLLEQTVCLKQERKITCIADHTQRRHCVKYVSPLKLNMSALQYIDIYRSYSI